MVDIEHIQSELNTITKMIWESSVDSKVLPVTCIPDNIIPCKTHSACVHILGGWHGSISIECEQTLTEKVARKMLHLGDKKVTKEDWSSVLKELTNVTGGNIKSLLGHNCILSTPNAWEGENFSFKVPESTVFLTLDFSFLESYFRVRIHESFLDLDGLI